MVLCFHVQIKMAIPKKYGISNWMDKKKHPSGSFSITQQKWQRCNQNQRRSKLKSSDQPLCGNMWKLQWGLSSFYRWWFILEQNREEDKSTAPNPVTFSTTKFLRDYLPFFCRQVFLDSTSGTKYSTCSFISWQIFNGNMTNNRGKKN